jgi:GntR family transcriptional regulator/MocR family aminotransferase
MEFEISRRSDTPLSRQIYNHMREGIQSGKLPSGSRLASTRSLAASLNVSRSTVCEAYDMLAAEGFIDSRPGAPTKVRAGLLLEQACIAPKREAERNPLVLADFTTGRPDLREFPMSLWLKSIEASMRSLDYRESGYRGPQGLPCLREEIASWMYRSRGITASPEDIFITSGTTQALCIIAGMFAEPGSRAVVEDPGVAGILDMLKYMGFELEPVPVDKHGIVTDGLKAKGARVVYLTPSHQFPLGSILPAGRRAALVRLARETGMYIVEDDYDSEFRHFGAPVSPLYSMDPQRVVYVGTFSKLLFPALRIGYAILPRGLHDTWKRLKVYADVQNPICDQAALADFLRTRRLDRHIHTMRRLYGRRRETLLSALGEYFKDGFEALGDAAGLHMAARFPGLIFGGGFSERARESGIRIATAEVHAVNKGLHEDTLLFGYGHLNEREIRDGVKLLREFMVKHGCLQ